MNAAEWMVRQMEQEGVRYALGVPGEETLALLDALRRSPTIRFIPTRHESGGAFMAAGYARATGIAQVALATLGPGATNLLTGVANANSDHTPLVALSGQSDTQNLHLPEFHQVLDLSAIYRAATRYHGRVEIAETAAEMTAQAFHAACGEPPGASFLELPSDTSFAEVSPDAGALPAPEVVFPRASAKVLDRAAAEIQKARCPILLIGHGIMRAAGGLEALAELEGATGLGFTTTYMGKGALDDRLPSALPTLGAQGYQAIFEKADLVISVGYDSGEIGPRVWNDRRLPVIHLAATAPVADFYYPTSSQVIGDLGHALRGLAARLDGMELGAEARAHMRKTHDLRLAIEAEGQGLDGRAVVAELRRRIPDDALVVSDVGQHKMLLARHYPVYRPGSLWITNGLSAMGYAIGAALGALLASPERPTVAVVGDGGLLMSLAELETARRLDLNLRVVVFCDNGYGLIEGHQIRHHLEPFGVHFGNPDWKSLGEAFGFPVSLVQDAEHLGPTLERVLRQEARSMTVIDVHYEDIFRSMD